MSNELNEEDNTDSSTREASAGGDVSTTGQTTESTASDVVEGDAHDEHPAHDGHGDAGAHVEATGHDGHDGHGGHGEDLSEQSTLVPTRFSQLLLPLAILLIVGILVAGPVINAFSPQQANAPVSEQRSEQQQTTGGEAQPEATATPVAPTPTAALPTQPPATPTQGTTLNLPLIATQTAVAIAGEQGEVARFPVGLQFGGAAFVVNKGSGLLPDWTPTQDADTATWIEGTVANHILYVPYNDTNAALFQAAKPGDKIKLEMNTGQMFEFEVNLVQRATNGPATQEGQFTVSTAMAQNHAGVTLFLTGDPATDRAVVQADFTGNIQ